MFLHTLKKCHRPGTGQYHGPYSGGEAGIPLKRTKMKITITKIPMRRSRTDGDGRPADSGGERIFHIICIVRNI